MLDARFNVLPGYVAKSTAHLENPRLVSLARVSERRQAAARQEWSRRPPGGLLVTLAPPRGLLVGYIPEERNAMRLSAASRQNRGSHKILMLCRCRHTWCC